MLSWSTILLGAALSGVMASALVAAAQVLRRKRSGETRKMTVGLAATAALSGFLGPLMWNAILRSTQSPGFFVDAPISILPASWQDVGSGVFGASTSFLLFGFGVLRNQRGQVVASFAILVALVAFVVDVYLY